MPKVPKDFPRRDFGVYDAGHENEPAIPEGATGLVDATGRIVTGDIPRQKLLKRMGDITTDPKMRSYSGKRGNGRQAKARGDYTK